MKTKLFLLLLFLLGTFSFAADADNDQTTNPNNPELVFWGTFNVVRVVDGDTFIIKEQEGETRIRLIGSDTPETVKPNSPVEPFGLEASAFTKKKILESNGKVTLYQDGDIADKYNRYLAIAFVTDKEGKKVNLNELLIREGLARARTEFKYSNASKKLFLDAQKEAKEKHLKIWSLPANQQGVESVKVESETKPDTQQKTVYITKTGSKYHSAGCRYLSKSQIPISLEDAKQRYSPCSVCRP
jgi:micrococcal nuclease